jgi:hypothetical protein
MDRVGADAYRVTVATGAIQGRIVYADFIVLTVTVRCRLFYRGGFKGHPTGVDHQICEPNVLDIGIRINMAHVGTDHHAAIAYRFAKRSFILLAEIQ